jgi:hypothetical protein
MFATANPSTGGFDVRGWKALLSLPAVAGIRYGRFDVKHKLSNQDRRKMMALWGCLRLWLR